MRPNLLTLMMLFFAAAASLAAGPATVAGRPFRVGFFNLNPGLDRQKPLAPLEVAGWTVNSGVLIGAFDQRWVGGLSFATRRVQWWFDGGSDMTAPPGSFGSAVVLGFRDGQIVKLDALSGKKQWATSLDTLTERPFLLNGTTLYVVTSAQVIYALDFQTGKTLWLYDCGFPEGLKLRGAARPIIYDGKLIVGLASGETVAVTADQGKLTWRYNPAYTEARFHDVVGEMLVRGGKLVMTRYDGLLAAIDLVSSVRSVVWQEQLPGIATSLLHNGRIYVGGINGDIYAYDIEDGRRIFRTPSDAAIMSMAASENVLYVAGADGRVTALDATEGSILWHDQLGSPIATTPVIYENAIYFMTGLKSIYGYQLMGATRQRALR